MNKLYIDQQGIIKVIDVPGRPALCRIEGVLISDYCSAACYCNPMASYRKAVAAAKEAGIELCTDNLTAKQLFDFLADIGIEGVESHQWLEKHKGEIIDLPEGWSIYFAWRCLKCGRLDCISCDSDCELDQKVAVLLPPVSEKPPIHHAQRAIRDEHGKVIGFEPFNKAKVKDACRETKAQARELTNQILSDSNAALNNAVSEKVEGQEELWSSIESVVSDEITKYWIEIPADQLAFNITEAIKEKFILRKP